MPTRRTIVFLALLPALALPAMGEDRGERARIVVATLLGEARSTLGEDDRGSGLRAAIEKAFDLDIWERFLLQKRADAFDDAQRLEFRGLLPDVLADLYERRFDRGMTAAPTVGEVSFVRRDALVASEFTRRNGGSLPVAWRLRERDGQMLIIDVVVAGASFLLLKRDEFSAIMDKGGADALLAHMRGHAP